MSGIFKPYPSKWGYWWISFPVFFCYLWIQSVFLYNKGKLCGGLKVLIKFLFSCVKNIIVFKRSIVPFCKNFVCTTWKLISHLFNCCCVISLIKKMLLNKNENYSIFEYGNQCKEALPQTTTLRFPFRPVRLSTLHSPTLFLKASLTSRTGPDWPSMSECFDGWLLISSVCQMRVSNWFLWSREELRSEGVWVMWLLATERT